MPCTSERRRAFARSHASPNDLLELAVEIGCRFAINTDAHAPGQLEWQSYAADKAVETGVTIDRIVNSWSTDELLEWTRP